MNALAIITGHSQGLGKALATLFLEKEDYEVLGISRKKSGLSHLRLKEVSLDLSDMSSVHQILPNLFPKANFDKIILVNNAGWIGPIMPLDKQNPKDIEAVNAINFLSPTLFCRQFLAQYGGEKAEKVICNISSGLAYRAESGLTGYCSSKSALAMLTEVLALEDHKNCRFFSLAPGVVDTPMQDEIRSASPSDFPKLDRFKDLKSSGSLVSAEETARKVLFLLDHPNRFEGVVQDVRKFDLG